jgi:hypothetical protein
MLALLLLCLLQIQVTWAVESFLFMDREDLHQPWGVLVPTASTLSSNVSFAPPKLSYNDGSLVIAVLPSIADSSIFEVYCSNTTGNEPVPVSKSSQGCETWSDKEDCTKAHCDWQNGHCVTKEYPGTGDTLVRYTTTDFMHYSTPNMVLDLANETKKLGTPLIKCIVRNDQTGEYVLMINDRLKSFVSSNQGLAWQERNTTGLNPVIDKDDLNLIFNNGRFVDMQISWQNHSLRYCDNGGCNKRRVVTSKTSSDGLNWSDDAPFVTPDEQDAPDLEFYRIRPFYIGKVWLFLSHIHCLYYARMYFHHPLMQGFCVRGLRCAIIFPFCLEIMNERTNCRLRASHHMF